MPRDHICDRLEMVLVALWLERGRPADARLRVPVDDLTAELGLDEGREGLLTLLAALGDLEECGAIAVSWAPAAGSSEVEVTLAERLHRDVDTIFGS